MPEMSNTAVNRAGQLLRNWVENAPSPDPFSEWTDEHNDAIDLVSQYRASVQRPLASVTVSVRQFVQRESSAVVVAQRLKRLPQIIWKLARFPGMQLARMQDVGGCRAILPGGRPEVAGVLRRMQRNSWDIRAIRDYVAEPKSTGYRAVHVVVMRSGRLIEIQLRSPGQHAWAESVEATTRTHPGLKDGRAPEHVSRYFALAGEIIALRETDLPVDEGMVRELAELEGPVFGPPADQ
jgi:putative GTP pyrophosphokinase